MLPVFAPSPVSPSSPRTRECWLEPLPIGVLVLLVEAGEHAGLHEVLAEDLRVVVLDDEQILVVEERRLVPERRVARAAPEHRMPGLRLPYCLVLYGLIGSSVLTTRVVQRQVLAAARDLDLVGGVGELQGVRRGVAERLVQRHHERLAGLIPVRVDGRGTDRRPTGSTGCSGESFFQLSCVYRSISRVVLLMLQSARPLQLRVVDGRDHRGHPVVAAASGRASRSAAAYRFKNAWPAGLIRLAGIRLPGNGAPVSGSMGTAG